MQHNNMNYPDYLNPVFDKEYQVKDYYYYELKNGTNHEEAFVRTADFFGITSEHLNKILFENL